MFGVPRHLICDWGTAFTSRSFTDYCTQFGIKRVLCATATPRANGQVERTNRTILSSIVALTEDEQRWDESATSVKWGINSTVNATTGKSPYELFFGYRPRCVNDAFLTAEVCNQERPELEKLRNEVSERVTSKQKSYKKYYDKKTCSYENV